MRSILVTKKKAIFETLVSRHQNRRGKYSWFHATMLTVTGFPSWVWFGLVFLVLLLSVKWVDTPRRIAWSIILWCRILKRRIRYDAKPVVHYGSDDEEAPKQD